MPTHDKLETALSVAEKIRTMLALGKDLQYKEPRRALSLSDEVLALIDTHDEFKRERADALLSKGTSLWRLGDYPNSIRASEISLAVFQEIGDNSGKASALSTLGLAALDRFISNRAIILRLARSLKKV
jgi:hypothetical protein